MPCQVGECPSGVPHNVPPALTPGSTPPQCGGGMRAPPKDPLKNVTNYKSAGWRKDLDHVLKAYYKHNYTSFKEAEWANLKDKFFEHLIQCQGMRDMRVVERAKTLRIAAWLHHLDMATDGDETASLSLEATQHGRGPLLELLLAPMMSSLTFVEVVQCVLAENRHRVESSLDNLQGHRAPLQGELDDLIEAH